jgi:hypothetical protein
MVLLFFNIMFIHSHTKQKELHRIKHALESDALFFSHNLRVAFRNSTAVCFVDMLPR